MSIRHAVFVVLPILLVSSAVAHEPVRKWVPLQGPVIEGQLIRVAGDKIYIRGAEGEVQSIKIELLASDSHSYLRKIRDPLPFWQTPEETELIGRVKQRLDRTGVVRVESPDLKLDNMGLVVGNDGAYNLVLCTSESEKLAYAQTIAGSPITGLDNLQFVITHQAGETLRRSQARFHASFPGMVVIKSPSQLAAGKPIVFSSLGLTEGQTLCVLSPSAVHPSDYTYQVGVVKRANSVLLHPSGFVTSYSIVSPHDNLAPGSVAMDDTGQVVGVIRRTNYWNRSKPNRARQEHEYLLEPLNDETGSLGPKFIWLVALPSTAQDEIDIAAFFIDPLNKLDQCELLIKPFDNDIRITAAATRDGTSIRTLAGGTTVELRGGEPPSAIRRLAEDVDMAYGAWAHLDLKPIRADDYVVFHAQVVYRGGDGRPKFSRLFTLNLATDAARIQMEIDQRKESLKLNAR